jgi:3-deoxy-manno-octulosonate cytidylyltransferase (CMP-KDO synthetase)
MADSAAIVIPARFASSRLPGKPLALIRNKPMIQWVCEAAAKVENVNRVIVATDTKEIAEVVKGFGGEVMLTDPAHPSGSDRVAEVAETLAETIVVNLQGDEPFIHPQTIATAIATVWDNPGINVGTLVRRIKTRDELTNPNAVRVVLDKHNHALYFTRQTIPFVRDMQTSAWLDSEYPFYAHVGIYVYRRDFLIQFVKNAPTMLEKAEKLEQLRILEHGYRIKAGFIEEAGISVDTPDDLALANQIAEKQTL